MENQIHFNPHDLKGMIKLMDEHGDSKTMYPGKNENGEDCYISIFYEKIVIRTLQDNGWNRINTYYRDGSCDETFDGKWNR